jgi:hypothetical protein
MPGVLRVHWASTHPQLVRLLAVLDPLAALALGVHQHREPELGLEARQGEIPEPWLSGRGQVTEQHGTKPDGLACVSRTCWRA